MKLFFAMTLLSLQVFAEGYTNITDKAMRGQYDEAVGIALYAKKLSCVDIAGKPYDKLASEIDVREYAELSVSGGEQPALVYSHTAGETTFIASFSTAADYKSLKSVLFRRYELRRVNRGTIIAPDFQMERVLVKQNSCSIN